MTFTGHVHRHDAHRMTDRDHRKAGLNGRPFAGAVPGGRTLGGNGRIGDQLDIGADDCSPSVDRAPTAPSILTARAAWWGRAGRPARSRRRRSSTRSSYPSTISAPVRPRRIRSRPSRSAGQARRPMVSQVGPVGAGDDQPLSPCRSGWMPVHDFQVRPGWRFDHGRCRRAGGTAIFIWAASASRWWRFEQADARGGLVTPGGTMAVVKPSRAAPASRRSKSGDRRRSPASPTHRRSRPSTRAGTGRRTAEVMASATARSDDGSVRRMPPDRRQVDVVLADPDAGARVQHSGRHRRPGLVDPADRRGRGASGAGQRAWISPISGRLPSEVTVTAVPGTGARRLIQEQPGRVSDPFNPVVVQQETTHPRRRAGRRFFDPADHARGCCGRPRSAAPRRQVFQATADRRWRRPW